MPDRPFYQPGASSVEGLPLALQMFHNHPLIMLKPHWHAQVEVNFIVRGTVHYRMNESRDLALGRRHVPVLGRPAASDGRCVGRRRLCRRASAAGAFLPAASARRSSGTG